MSKDGAGRGITLIAFCIAITAAAAYLIVVHNVWRELERSGQLPEQATVRAATPLYR